MTRTNENPTQTGSYRRQRRWQRILSIPHYLKELKKLRSQSDYYMWMQFKLPYIFAVPSFPPRINLELTNHCNMSCTYCYRGVMHRDHGYMDYDIVCKVVDEVSSHSTSVVKIGGLGEPALHKEFAKIMQLLQDNGVHNIVYTNGLLFQLFSPKKILEWKIPHIVVSIDGIDARSYELQRTGGNFHQIKSNVLGFHKQRKELANKKTMVEIRHVILPSEKLNDINKFRKNWLTIADTVMFNHLLPSGPMSNVDLYKERRCRDIRREMYIRWNGKVPLCGYQHLVTTNQEWIADIYNVSIEEAWQNAHLREVRAKHEQGTNQIPTFCRFCHQTH